MDKEGGNKRKWENLSPFPHSLFFSSSFSHSLSIFSQPGCQAGTNCAALYEIMVIFRRVSLLSVSENSASEKARVQVMSKIWNKNHEKKSKRPSLSFTIFASLPFFPRKGARHARHPLRSGLFTMIAQLPIEAQLARGKAGVGIVNPAFDGWETTTPVHNGPAVN